MSTENHEFTCVFV